MHGRCGAEIFPRPDDRREDPHTSRRDAGLPGHPGWCVYPKAGHGFLNDHDPAELAFYLATKHVVMRVPAAVTMLLD